MHKIDPTSLVTCFLVVSHFTVAFFVVNMFLCLSIFCLKTFTALQTSVLVLSSSPCTIDGALGHIDSDVLCQERPATQESPFVESGMYRNIYCRFFFECTSIVGVFVVSFEALKLTPFALNFLHTTLRCLVLGVFRLFGDLFNHDVHRTYP